MPQGQTGEPELSVFEGLLEKALGESVVAIHWDKAREELQGGARHAGGGRVWKP